MSTTEAVKDWALTAGSQLATIEDHVGRCAGMVMQAAIHSQLGILESASREAAELRLAVLRLESQLVDMRAEMQR
jgi:hypothetical protein